MPDSDTRDTSCLEEDLKKIREQDKKVGGASTCYDFVFQALC